MSDAPSARRARALPISAADCGDTPFRRPVLPASLRRHRRRSSRSSHASPAYAAADASSTRLATIASSCAWLNAADFSSLSSMPRTPAVSVTRPLPGLAAHQHAQVRVAVLDAAVVDAHVVDAHVTGRAAGRQLQRVPQALLRRDLHRRALRDSVATFGASNFGWAYTSTFGLCTTPISRRHRRPSAATTSA